MALTTISQNLQCGLCVCCRQCELRNVEAQWSSIHFRIKQRWCLCMAKQVGMVERQHECTEPHTLTDSTTHITQHLEPFISVCVNMSHVEATSNICCDVDGIQAMYCVPGLFGWRCSAVPSTVKTIRFWTQGDMNFYTPFPVRNHPLKFVRGLKTHPVYSRGRCKILFSFFGGGGIWGLH